MYVSLVFFASRLNSPSILSYIHFPQSHKIQCTPGILSSNPFLADLSICAVFLFCYVNCSDVMLLQKSNDFIGGGVIFR
jgi:hypothetical protein